MKEITRVHIANTQFDIEIDAKKTLQTYLNKIKEYTADDDLINDVESRIVELLSEHGIKKGGVVTASAVAAIIEQLGAPEAFSDDDIPVTESRQPGAKKLYRDSGHAWIGGIASGLARYFGTRAWWIRILMVLSIPFSSGLTILVYVLLWLVIPATKTPSDILRLMGEPVTVSKLGEQLDPVKPLRDRKIVRVLSIILGILLLLVALAAVCIGAFGISYGISGGYIGKALSQGLVSGDLRTWLLGSAVATAIAGLAFTLLAAYLLISWRFKRPVVIVMIIFLGLTVVGGISSVGSAIVNRQQAIDRVQANVITKTVELPSLSDVNAVVVANKSSAHVSYVVTVGDKPRMEITTLRGSKDPDVTIKNGTLALTVPAMNNENALNDYYPETITIYGPAITALTVNEGQLYLDGSGKSLDSLAVTVASNASLIGSSVTIPQLTATLGQYGGLTLNEANVTSATVTAAQFADVQFGTVADLAITAPDTCPSSSVGVTTVTADGVTSDSFTINGKSLGVQDYKTSCIEVTFDGPSKLDD